MCGTCNMGLPNVMARHATVQQLWAATLGRFEPCTKCLVCCLLQSILLSERQETKLALTLEKQALEEARAARVKVLLVAYVW